MPLIKPAPWAANRAAVLPEYQDLWRGLRIAVAWPDSKGRAANLVTNQLGTIEGTDLSADSLRPLGVTWQRSTTTQGSHLDVPFQVDPSVTAFTAVCFLHVDAASLLSVFLHQHDGTGVGRNWLYNKGDPDVWGSFLGGSAIETDITEVVGELNVPVVRFDGSAVVVGANGDWSNASSVVTPESATGDHIWMDHKSANQAPDTYGGYGFYIWDRYLTDAELDRIYDDPFALLRPNWDYVTAAAASIGPHVFFDLTDLPVDFGNAESATITVRARGQNLSSTLKLFAQLFQSDESTTMSDEVECVAISSDDSFTNYTVSLTGLNTSSGKSVWDNARIRFRWGT